MFQEQKVLLFPLTLDQLHETIRNAVAEVLAENRKANQKEMLSAKELCSLLGISISTLNKWKAENKIPYKRMGKRNFYPRSEVIGALKDSNYKKFKRLNL